MNKEIEQTNKTLFDSHYVVDHQSGAALMYMTGIDTGGGIGFEIKKANMPECNLSRSDAEALLISEIDRACKTVDAGDTVDTIKESNNIAQDIRRGYGKLTTDGYLVYVGAHTVDQGVHIVHDSDSDQYALVFHDGWEKYYRRPA